MKKLFSTIDRTEALNAKFTLEANGVPIYIGGEHAGPAPGFVNADSYTVWVCLDEQFEDAYRFIENESHEISCPIDVAEFYRSVEKSNEKGSTLGSDKVMLSLMGVGIIGFIVWVIIRVSGVSQ